ncbi:MAG: ATP-binding protein [Lentisphaeria bacterium]|nr:ATP-binding protein [Lentisphaeria bacterium]
MISVQSIYVNSFRCFIPGTNIELGDRVTLLAGLNGTAKSTLLGMIAQPLGFPTKSEKVSIYTRVYDSFDLSTYKTVGERNFQAKFSEVFRISQKFDKPRNLDYVLRLKGEVINDGCSELPVRSEKRGELGIRMVTNSTNRSPGRGNFPHPVIYLGLERLRPLSTLSKKDIIGKDVLPEDEKRIWNDIYRVVMICNGNEKLLPEHLNTGKSFKQSYHSVETTYFDAESASAGQDNLGQIISAIISFHRLKKELKEHYQGGVLLIDEFDATLHPVAQKLLLQKLVEYSTSLNIQIITTTHSLPVLEDALQKHKSNVKCVYFQKKGKNVEINNDVDYDFVASDLAHIQKKAKIRETEKTSIVFEDVVGCNFFKRIVGRIFDGCLKTFNTENRNSETCLSNGVLLNIVRHLVSKKIPDFQKVIYILDPDSKSLISKKSKTLLSLPGQYFIEKEMNLFLVNLNDDDQIWDIMGVQQSFCIANNNNIEADPLLTSEQEKKKRYKKWFDEQQRDGHFGPSSATLFEEWCKRNSQICRDFCISLLEALIEVKNPLVQAQEKEIRDKINKKYSSIADNQLLL